MNQKPRVISIAAVSGGGKTTITNQLISKLNKSKALYFDDYEFEECPEDICEWVEKGADHNEWNLHPLIQDTQLLLDDQSLDYIVLDYPFAYLHNGMRNYIDIAIYIDTPLDIAMARRILRDYKENPIDDIRNDLTNYIVRGRAAYINMEKTIKPSSDIVIDGYLHTTFIVDRIIEEVTSRLS
jgi:uridine kinase